MMWWIEAMLFSVPHPAAGASFRLLSQHSPVQGLFWDTPCPAWPSLPSDSSGLISQAGFIPTLHEQDGEEPAWLPPQQQPKNGNRVVLGLERFGNQPWSRRGQRGWAGKQLKAAAGGAGFVQTNLSEEWSAKTLLNIWKLRLFTSEVYTLTRSGDFFFFFSGTVENTSSTSDWPPCQFSWHSSKPHRH